MAVLEAVVFRASVLGTSVQVPPKKVFKRLMFEAMGDFTEIGLDNLFGFPEGLNHRAAMQ